MSQLSPTTPRSQYWVHTALLLLPLGLSQLVLQGGDRLSGPYLGRLAIEAHVRPDAAEVEYLTVLFGLLVLCELTILVPSAIWWFASGGVVDKPATSLRNLLWIGIRCGVPFALLTYFLLWWTHSVPENLPYGGIVGTRLPHYLPIVFLLGSFAAFCEEFYFRRVLFTVMRRSMSSPTAVVISVTLFALWHPNAYANPGHMGAIVAGGVFYSILLIRHGSVVPGMICHALVNVFAVLFANLTT